MIPSESATTEPRRLSSQFPLNPESRMLDSRLGIRNGVASAIRTYQLEFPVTGPDTSSDLEMSPVSVISGPEFDISSLLQSSRETTPDIELKPSLKLPPHPPDIGISISHAKISTLVKQICSSTDPFFREINNFVINAILQQFTTSNVHEINSKILNKNYRETLQDQVEGLVKDKYLDLRLDEFMDAMAATLVGNFNRPETAQTTDDPKLYSLYKKIWRLEPEEFRYFDKDDFEPERYSDLGPLLDLYFDTGLEMNLQKLKVYFYRDPIEAEEQAEEMSLQESLSREISNTISDEKDGFVKKTVRFEDNFAVLEINEAEPAVFVHCDAHRIDIIE